MKKTAVVFKDGGARIYRGPAATKYQGDPNALINPELPVGVPPHLWRKEGNRIVTTMAAEAPHEEAKFPKLDKLSLAIGYAAGLITGFAIYAAL